MSPLRFSDNKGLFGVHIKVHSVTTCSATINNIHFNFVRTANNNESYFLRAKLNKLDSDGNFFGGLPLSEIKNLNFRNNCSLQ